MINYINVDPLKANTEHTSSVRYSDEPSSDRGDVYCQVPRDISRYIRYLSVIVVKSFNYTCNNKISQTNQINVETGIERQT